MGDKYSDCIDIALNELDLAQKAPNREIAGYPTPIAGCDTQHHHLLAQCTRVHSALSALQDRYFVPAPRQPDLHSKVESR